MTSLSRLLSYRCAVLRDELLSRKVLLIEIVKVQSLIIVVFNPVSLLCFTMRGKPASVLLAGTSRK